MPLFNFLAPEVTITLSGKSFSCRLYFQQVWCWWPHPHTKQLAHNLVSLTSSALVMATEDVYNLDIIVIFYRAQPSKTLVQGIICGCKIQKDCLTLAFVVKTTCTNIDETCDYSLDAQDASEGGCQQSMCVGCKPNGMDDIICIWELDDEPQCTFQISKVRGTFNYGQRCYSSL